MGEKRVDSHLLLGPVHTVDPDHCCWVESLDHYSQSGMERPGASVPSVCPRWLAEDLSDIPTVIVAGSAETIR